MATSMSAAFYDLSTALLLGLLAAGLMGPPQARGKRIHTAIKKLLGAGLVIASLGFFILPSKAQAAAPTFNTFSGIAAAASGGADPTVTLPAHALNDILLLATIVRSNTATVATPAGWTQIGSPTVRSTVATYQFFWKRAASGSETNPLIDRTGTTGDVYAAVITYRGATTTGDPWEVQGTVTKGTTDPSVITGITTLTANSLVVVAVAGENDNNASIITTGTAPSAYAVHYVESATGAHGVITFSEAARTTAGATGNVSVDWNTAVPVGFGGIVLALRPPQLPFNYRKAITIDHTKVGNSGAPTTLANYPFLYSVTDANLKTVANGGHVSNAAGAGTITIDNPGASTATGGGVSSLTIPSFAVGAGANRLLLVGVSVTNNNVNGTRALNSVTFNGVNLLQVTTVASGDDRVWIYRMVNPPNVTADIVATFAGTGGGVLGAVSFTGVDQTTPLGTPVTESQGDGSITVTAADNEWIFDVIVLEGGTLTVGADQTQRWNLSSGSIGGASTQPGSFDDIMSWTYGAATSRAQAGVAIKPAGSLAGYDMIFRAFDSDNPGANICGAGVDDCTLDHEIEEYDPTTGKLVAWVRIPVLKAFSYTTPAPLDTKIYIYYGNTDITTSTENPTGVWDTDFKGVWHVKEATDAGKADSTVNTNHGAPKNGPATITGKISGALTFDGTNDVLRVNDANSLDMSSAFTLSAWIKPNAAIDNTADYNQGLMDKGVFQLFFDKSDGKLHFTTASGTSGWTLNFDTGAAIELTASLAAYNGKLYAGEGTSNGDGDVIVYDGTSWKKPGDVGFTGFNGTFQWIPALTVYKGKLYAGQASANGAGDVLVFDGTSWIKPGDAGCTPSSGCFDGAQQLLGALAAYNGKLYAGQGTAGNTNGTGDIAVFDNTSWIKPPDAGCTASSGCFDGAADIIRAFAVYNGKLYAGQGDDAGEGDVLVFDGTSWIKPGDAGCTPSSGCFDGAQEIIHALAVYDGKLYAGQGQSAAGDGDVLVFDGTSWVTPASPLTSPTCSTNTTCFDGAFEKIQAFAVYNGRLYAGQGDSAGMADILVFDGTQWWKPGDAGAPPDVYDAGATIERVRALAVYNGKLYATLGESAGDGDILVLDNGKSLSSAKSSWAVDWHHVVASYDGTTMSIYVAGALDSSQSITFTPNTNALSLLLGTTYGSQMAGGSAEAFAGILDEIRISSVARSAHWIKTEYNNTCTVGVDPGCTSVFYTVGTEEGPNAPSLARLTQAHALSHDGASTRVVELHWRTSYEVDHLGFHVYREEQGARTRITPGRSSRARRSRAARGPC
ncbi:MAG: DUF2341 domain-containing protein [Nitrospirae bacterium]|nr:MAG: DUF2341 domain-containing protein [Nitrospirota bacterium]